MKEILIKLCVAILFKFQWQTENYWQRLDSGPGFVSKFTTKNNPRLENIRFSVNFTS